MDTIDIHRKSNVDSDNIHEVLGCSTAADFETLTIAYRDLSRKYYPGQYIDYEEASAIFQKIGASYAALVCHTMKLNGKESCEIVVPSTERAAKQAYEEKFGVLRGCYYGEGGLIGIPFAFEMRQRLHASRRVLDYWSSRICGFRVHFFRSWMIKWKINPFLLICETLLTWGVYALCALCFVLGVDKTASLFGEIEGFDTLVFDVVSAVVLLSAEFIVHFWYGFTRDPVSNSTYEEISAVDLADIRDVCSYYFHSDRHQRPQALPMLLSKPFLVVEYFWLVLLSTITCGKCLRILKATAAILSMISHYLIWLLGGNYGKLAVAVSLLVNRNLYNALLFRKGSCEFLQSLVFGENLVFTTMQQDKPPTEASKTFADPNTESDDSVDLETNASIWGRIDSPSVAISQRSTRSRAGKVEDKPVLKKGGESSFGFFESVLSLVSLREEEESVCEQVATPPPRNPDLEAQTTVVLVDQVTSVDLEGDASVWGRIDAAPTQASTHRNMRARIVEEDHGEAQCGVFESVLTLTTLREEGSACGRPQDSTPLPRSLDPETQVTVDVDRVNSLRQSEDASSEGRTDGSTDASARRTFRARIVEEEQEPGDELPFGVFESVLSLNTLREEDAAREGPSANGDSKADQSYGLLIVGGNRVTSDISEPSVDVDIDIDSLQGNGQEVTLRDKSSKQFLENSKEVTAVHQVLALKQVTSGEKSSKETHNKTGEVTGARQLVGLKQVTSGDKSAKQTHDKSGEGKDCHQVAAQKQVSRDKSSKQSNEKSGAVKTTQLEASTTMREKKRALVKLYRSIKRRIEGDFYGGKVLKRNNAIPEEAAEEELEWAPVEKCKSVSVASRKISYVTERNCSTMTSYFSEEGSGQETTSETTKESTLTSMGREYEDLVMNTSYLVSANPTIEYCPTSMDERDGYTLATETTDYNKLYHI